ncbi:MAG: PBECR4 domain-containing protein [Parvimonas sp.]|uniref:PBECR4 domain-containing protein n=1 Tax=Parvimonas sp. TaxID=1944660 RepID=UPI002A75F544|nr:PBECR4 domain-containing protein [Parvimonas sp.]MDY3050715.1 PBECR4 domain-containing protein [Parvimonas sp.]
MEEKSYLAKETLLWSKNFDNINLKITSETKEFNIKLGKENIPHLLGLQYINRYLKSQKGIELYNEVIKNDMSDEDIFKKVKKSHPKKDVVNVKNRIRTFKSFMENLENARIVEQTNPKTHIKSKFLVIDTKDNFTMHLGVLETGNLDVFTDFEVERNIFETYIVQNNDKFYKYTSIYEPIKSIEKYEENYQKWRKFSFNLEKDKELEEKFLIEEKEIIEETELEEEMEI